MPVTNHHSRLEHLLWAGLPISPPRPPRVSSSGRSPTGDLQSAACVVSIAFENYFFSRPVKTLYSPK